jgi:hypothetical protein
VASGGGDEGARPAVRERIVERRVFVNAEPAVVWATLHDPRHATMVMPELRLEAATGPWPAAGAVRAGRLRIGMLREPATVESLEARPGSRFRMIVFAGAFHAEWIWTLEPRSGGTLVVHRGSGDVDDRWAGWLAGIGGDAVTRTTEAHLRGLKAAAEGAPR